MPTRKWPHKLRRFAALDSAERRLLLRAVVWLAVARLWLVFVPFQRLASRLEPGANTAGADAETLRRVGAAVRSAGANVPWRSDCFPQSIAAYKLLQREGIGSTIHLGVDKSGDDTLLGHAWLTCGDVVVTGGEDLDRYVEIHRLGE